MPTHQKTRPVASRSAPAVQRSAVLMVGLLAALLDHAPVHGQGPSMAQLFPPDQLDIRTDDLVRLATAHADAVGELKVARLRLQTLEALRGNAVVTNLEMQVARVQVETAQRKVLILRTIAEKLLAAAEVKLRAVQRLETVGQPAGEEAAATAQARFQLAQAEATVHVLQLILETQ